MKYTDRASKKRIAIYAAVMFVLLLNIVGAIMMIVIEAKETDDSAATEYQELSAEVHTGAQSVDFDLLREKNPDIRAWIICEGTGIDYPIVQGADNDYYRDHLFSGKKDRLGCLYIDCAQTGDLSEKNTVICGGEQLEPIYKYERQDYYELLPSMTLLTPDGSHTVLLVAAVKASDPAEVIKTDFADDAEFTNYVLRLKERSVFHSNADVSESDRLITLFTESGESGFVLIGKLV